MTSTLRRRSSAVILASAATAVLAAEPTARASAIEPPLAGSRTTVTVRFRDARTCDVSVAGPLLQREALRLQPGPADAGADADFLCDVPAIPPGAGVDLAVVLPSGAPRPDVAFPRLDWTEHGGRWTGTASLPAAPAFVRVGGSNGRLGRRARWLDVVALAATGVAILWTILYTARSADAEKAS